MTKYFCMLSFLWIVLATPLAAQKSLIYVPNSAGTTVSVIDPATNKVVGAIEDIQAPEAVGFSPDGERVYVTSFGESVLAVVDRKTGRHIKKVPLSGIPNDLMVTKDGKQVLVCINSYNDVPGALDIVDTATLERRTISLEYGLHDIVLTGDGKYAIGGSGDDDSASVFELPSGRLSWKVKFGDNEGVRPMTIENGPDGAGRRLFLQIRNLHGFSVVDFAKREEVTRIMLPEESGGFARPAGHGIGLAPDGKTIWANSRKHNAVFVYSATDFKLLGRVNLPVINLPDGRTIGASPHWVTFSHDSKTAYVSNDGIKSVSAIDVKTLKEVAQIPVGEQPARLTTLVLP